MDLGGNWSGTLAGGVFERPVVAIYVGGGARRDGIAEHRSTADEAHHGVVSNSGRGEESQYPIEYGNHSNRATI